ncbi:RrF2 family transcriptional regulator [Rhodohalobacter mucosus]|uniref:Transcriptional regulator n=1 Tax=Rhodohalobacter mucosus TaxID=2079485 RepID=A0A316TYP3_9BACT|nr:Rrf2 family transcriptional regulator [Rhodohalobacter mucosus]PWN07992.1 transcriptional regulator [Rhodohalobacter mucosus]
MILSKSSIYGLRASVLLAGRGESGYTNIRELSDDLGLSFYFLTKVLQRLTAAGIVESCKGPKGGVRLKGNPGDISFMDIIVAIEGDLDLNECLLGLSNCGDLSPCRFHGKWSGLKKEILELLRETRLINTYKTGREIPDAKTVADLIRK